VACLHAEKSDGDEGRGRSCCQEYQRFGLGEVRREGQSAGEANACGEFGNSILERHRLAFVTLVSTICCGHTALFVFMRRWTGLFGY